MDLQAIVDRVLKLVPGDLPPAPWVLKRSPRTVIGTGLFMGGPYMTVRDNTAWLAALQRDLQLGPDGPRGATGAVEDDLRALSEVFASMEASRRTS